MSARPLVLFALAHLLVMGGSACSKSSPAPADASSHEHEHGHRETTEHTEADADSHEHGHDEHAEETSASARFEAGEGLWLAEGTAYALGVQFVQLEKRTVAPSFQVIARVFEAGPPARASARVPAALASRLERSTPRDARLDAVRRELVSPLNEAEAIFELEGTPPIGSALTLTLTEPARESLVLPRSALLRTATGTFVYVARDGRFVRVPVVVDDGDGEDVVVAEGLRGDETVARSAVEQLWLTELRLTKGGGHSH